MIHRVLKNIVFGFCFFFLLFVLKEHSCVLLLTASKYLLSREIPEGWQKINLPAAFK